MKANKISIEAEGFKMKATPERLVQLLIAGLFTQALPPAANLQPVSHPAAPAIGEYWPGQGGINGGFVPVRGDVPAHYLIIAKDDVGAHEWGGRGKESGATSKTDGCANSIALCNSDDDHPAASACTEHQADGHHDFYLPAAAELYQGWLNCPEAFAKDSYYWSSSQRSADYAFYLTFGVGTQGYGVNYDELRVRPVRRFFI
ncbi:DUF1566 domain-containing protein [Pseudomonas sp. UMAB-40]|uniref:DUF1566 domain-containing protein n=1 Tax=Pseudomonas sp. UMAB-40 TaxID=1365407 RepID=UPI001C5678F6|nr:DUF1566 domain-containing protein [Pseudomonas sp. UMAB-40]